MRTFPPAPANATMPRKGAMASHARHRPLGALNDENSCVIEGVRPTALFTHDHVPKFGRRFNFWPVLGLRSAAALSGKSVGPSFAPQGHQFFGWATKAFRNRRADQHRRAALLSPMANDRRQAAARRGQISTRRMCQNRAAQRASARGGGNAASGAA